MVNDPLMTPPHTAQWYLEELICCAQRKAQSDPAWNEVVVAAQSWMAGDFSNPKQPDALEYRQWDCTALSDHVLRAYQCCTGVGRPTDDPLKCCIDELNHADPIGPRHPGGGGPTGAGSSGAGGGNK